MAALACLGAAQWTEEQHWRVGTPLGSRFTPAAPGAKGATANRSGRALMPSPANVLAVVRVSYRPVTGPNMPGPQRTGLLTGVAPATDDKYR
jgi:hypothetical protein